MRINLTPLTTPMLEEILHGLPDIERTRRLNSNALPAKGKSVDEWLKGRTGDIFAVVDEEKCVGYALITSPSRSARISDIYLVLLRDEELLVRAVFNQLVTFALRYRGVHKIVYSVPSSEQHSLKAALAEGFKQEAIFDEAIFFDRAYVDLVLLGLLTENVS